MIGRRIIFLYLSLIISIKDFAQADNEIQVYSSPTIAPRSTIFELHSNYTFRGSNYLSDQSLSHYLNETLEITHGLSDNTELGFYIFTSLMPTGKYAYLGSHIRPRITVPQTWNWPFGASLSVEFGFFREQTSAPFRWEGEIRPIIDRTYGNFYISFNPNIDFILTGTNKHWGIGPQLKTVYSIHGKTGIGIEYYSSLGTFQKINASNQEEHLLGPALDLYQNPKWELNMAFLLGLTPESNHAILKIVLGRKISPREKSIIKD